MKVGINLLKKIKIERGLTQYMKKNKNKNEFKPIYKKIGRAVARPSPLMGPPMLSEFMHCSLNDFISALKV